MWLSQSHPNLLLKWDFISSLPIRYHVRVWHVFRRAFSLFVSVCYPLWVSRLLHDGEQLRKGFRPESASSSADPEGEWHPLYWLPLLLLQPRSLQPGSLECLREGERWSPREPCLERVWGCHRGLGEGRASHQHLLASFLPGMTLYCSLFLVANAYVSLYPLPFLEWVDLERTLFVYSSNSCWRPLSRDAEGTQPSPCLPEGHQEGTDV